MKKDLEKLTDLFKNGKISEDDFKLLSAALVNRNSRIPSIFAIAINPFQRIAGASALIIGLMIIVIMSYLGVIAKVYFPGIIDVLNSVVVKNPQIPLSFQLLLYQNLVCWLILSILFFIGSKVFQPKKIRIIDFLGTVALARYPFLLVTAFISIIQIINPNFMNIDITKGIQSQMSFGMILFSLLVISFAIWQITTYFFALKVSSGLIGKKLWITFVVALILGEAISWPLTTLFTW